MLTTPQCTALVGAGTAHECVTGSGSTTTGRPVGGSRSVNAASPHVVTDQVLIKVTKTGDGDQCPTPEGIHQDGSEVSAVTMIKRDRVTSGGETRLWSLDATTGNYCANLASTPSTRADTP